jgi:hypothetical protein
MAGSGRKVFANGNTLSASDIQNYLQDQAVMYFADAASRTTAIPSPTEGMVTYRADIDGLEVYNGASYVPVNRNVVSYTINTSASLSLTTTTETGFFSAPSFTPITGRLYEITYSIGSLVKTTAAGNIIVRLHKDNVAGATISAGVINATSVGLGFSFTKTTIGTLSNTAFIPVVTVQSSNNGVDASNATYEGAIIIKDIGLA